MAFRDNVQYISELVVDLLRTADPPNPRWELVTEGLGNQLRAFTGIASEQQPGHLSVLSAVAGGVDNAWIEILAPQLSGAVGAAINVLARSNGFTQVDAHSGGINSVALKVQSASTGADATNTGVFIQGSGVGGLSISGLPDYDTGWINPTMNSPWVNFSTPAYPGVAYRRINGIVYLDGVIKATSPPATGSVIFTLPAKFRPAAGIRLFACMGGDNTAGRIDVDGSGNVTYQTGVSGYMSLATIRFPADN